MEKVLKFERRTEEERENYSTSVGLIVIQITLSTIGLLIILRAITYYSRNFLESFGLLGIVMVFFFCLYSLVKSVAYSGSEWKRVKSEELKGGARKK